MTNGTKFYLQPKGDTNYVDNLAVLSATVAAQAPSVRTASVFTVTPVPADSEFGVATISADATCPYEVHIGSPDGGRFGSGTAVTSAQTADWVQFGLQFFLQRRVTPHQREPSPPRPPSSSRKRTTQREINIADRSAGYGPVRVDTTSGQVSFSVAIYRNRGIPFANAGSFKYQTSPKIPKMELADLVPLIPFLMHGC